MRLESSANFSFFFLNLYSLHIIVKSIDIILESVLLIAGKFLLIL